jgi:CARDB protein/glycosyl hydrolase family 123/F5/8 type C domain-containing protein
MWWHARSGSTLVVLTVLLLFALPWPSAAQTSLTGQAQSIIARVPAPSGSGAGLSVIRDGDRPSSGSGDSRRQYDSYDGPNAASEDWVGYTFASSQTFSQVVFQEGMHFWDGGWFNNLTVQVRQSGSWVTVRNLATSPTYAGRNVANYTTYTLRFDPIQGDAIRIYGAPGGSAAFISVAELDVFGSGGTPSGGTSAPADASVSGQAQSIIARVPAPTGSGASLSVVRDRDWPASGSGDSRRQYDSYDGPNAASEDWVGYTFASTQTFTRVVFQEGIHFWDGGWFNNLTAQVRQSGSWVTVRNLATSPAYAGRNVANYTTYTLRFDPIQGDAIRIYGAPGGSAAFISVAELDVFAAASGTGGTTAKPDLTVGSVSVSPGSVSSGGSLTVNFTVRNAGTAAVGASSTGVYLASSPDAVLSGLATLKTASVPSLAAGASTTVSASATLPATNAGSYFIIVAADPGGAIAESVETNNRASAALSVGGSTSGLTVWVTDPLTRVQPTDPPDGVASAWIKAARNEYESFQVVIRAPSGQSLSNVNVVASNLVNSGGASAGTVKLYREHYVRVASSTGSSPYPPGWWPDALIPFVNPTTGLALSGGRFPGAPFSVSAGQNQPIWVEVYVSKTAPAGTYQGNLTVTANGYGPQNVPVTLTVWNFTMPNRPSLETMFGGTDQGDPTKNQRYLDEFSRHNIAPLPPDSTAPRVRSDGSLDSSASDAQLAAYLERFTTWVIPWWPGGFPFSDPLGANRGRTQRYFHDMQEYLRSRGWLNRAFVYVYDEPDNPDKMYWALEYVRLIRSAAPDLRLLVTTLIRSEFYGLVNTWGTLFREYDNQMAQDRMSRGEKVWSYTSLTITPTMPTWQLDHPLFHYRLPGWINWSNGVTGLLYWSTVYWLESADPWTDPTTYGPQVGEGALIYPGKDVGYDGPIASIRLKAIRDGIDDYEYLKILTGLGDRATAADTAGKVGRTFTDWTRNPDDVLANRDRLGERINQLAR